MDISINEQGSPEWHEERYGRIGGTGLNDLMAYFLNEKKEVTDLALFYSLLAAHSEDFYYEESFTSKDMERGTEMEPEARKDAGEYLGVEFLEFGCCTRPDLPLNHLSPDGLTADFKQSCEIKCPDKHTHAKYLVDDIIPEKYLWQNIDYFLINKDLEKHHFVSFRPENKYKPLFIKTMTRESLFSFKVGKKEYELSVNDLVSFAEDRSKEMLEAVNKEIENQQF